MSRCAVCVSAHAGLQRRGAVASAYFRPRGGAGRRLARSSRSGARTSRVSLVRSLTLCLSALIGRRPGCGRQHRRSAVTGRRCCR